MTVGVGAQRDVETSFYSDRPYFLYTLYEGSVRQALFHHFDIGGSLQYTTIEYQQFLTGGSDASRARSGRRAHGDR